MNLSERLAQAKAERGTTPATVEQQEAPTNGQRQRSTPAGDPFSEVKRTVHSSLVETLGPKLYDSRMTQTELEKQVRSALQSVLALEDRPLTMAERARIAQEIADDILGYGPIEPFLRDPEISEVMVNSAFDIWIERSGKLRKVDAKFNDEAHLRRTIEKIVAKVGRRVDESSPMVDARLADGSRVNAVVPPLALDGSNLTIRKFSADPFTVDDLVSFGTFTQSVAQLLEACVRGRLNPGVRRVGSRMKTVRRVLDMSTLVQGP